ncbi:MAG: PSD1 domain-containing protein, partial [Planctomycetaceae bacterium]|nr:PSD1 domain-containing protein [Planctomycetaceae bacterium]
MQRSVSSAVAAFLLLGCVAWLPAGTASSAFADEQPAVNFDRQIRPLLSNRCFACHGPDENHREGGLRLDVAEAATAELASGSRAIVPGKPEDSELLRRVATTDDSLRMPPPDSGPPLTGEEQALLRKWIASGAGYTRHWSLVPPRRPELPAVQQAEWCRTPIDRFVLARLEQEQLAPSAVASRSTLIRRLSFDLTGLPPSPEEVATFVKDESPEAYGKLVERLLASEQFGERMAMFWLDAARYSDTDGFQGDTSRTNWPWRDWVIRAFNSNMPYDQFTVEQFAGDLLPDATPEQQLATCFHRNHMTNGEGGRDPEESRIDYVIDRVNTMGTVWLGLTLGCTQCHTHKYDPITHADYYGLFAFFNSIDEDGRAGTRAVPYLDWKSPEAVHAVSRAEDWLQSQQARLQQVKTAAEPRFQKWLGQQLRHVAGGYSAWQPLKATSLDSRAGTQLEQDADGIIQASGPDPHHEDYRIVASCGAAGLAGRRITGLKLEVLPHRSHTGGGLSRSDSGHFILSDIKLRLQSTRTTEVRDIAIAAARADYMADPGKHGGYGNVKHTLDDDPRNGWATFDKDPTEPRTAVFALAVPLELAADDELIVELQQRALSGRHNIGRFRLLLTDQPGETPRSLKPAPLEDLATLARAGDLTKEKIPAPLVARLRQQYLEDDLPSLRAQIEVDRAALQLAEFRKAADTQKVMVLKEREEPRETHILLRGVWNQKGKTVERTVPAAVAPWPEGEQPTRLALARWLTSRQNPLTARVTVNHLWGQLWGAGLVRTAEDFGSQGERPTHPELLDWLAVELMDSGWNLKHVLRLMVSSATYRQASDASASLMGRDPGNRLLARGARFRLPAWMIRDGALESAGLLNTAVGGPPVRPWQPPGVWADITMGRFHYEPSTGPARYR